MKLLVVFIVLITNVLADVSYSAGAFTGNFSLIPQSTMIGIVIGVILTVIVFHQVRKLLVGAKRY